ncbi:SPX domain-containing membrane protein OsI_17046-like isoform X2 [Lolium rigidum]|uniref:SPX domain-containing membrane protein OsI_17046-like isoform X2 n=1 Tax=Lolium rigidum TaxID=89674 RepID=UPI001F5DCF25|nr:SPX domain-containing membrane protein OsI_17046-like isoform X2 [Lolium rigidum]
MVNFGKKLAQDQVEEWKGYYINYKLMKKMLKQYVQQTQIGGKDCEQILKEFSRILDDQIERIVLFLLQQQGHLASRIEELGAQRSAIARQVDTSRVFQLREDYREVGRDLVKLLRFVDMNATGLRKILKKFDKRFGYKFTDYYVTTRANHPYSQLQQVFKQVGIVAVAGALSRNLAYLEDEHRGSFLSIYDNPSVVLKDPIIDQVNNAVQKLTHATNFMQYLGQHALIVQDDTTSESEDTVNDESYHFMSLMLNLVNTFLYMVNTYIIVPTADDYSVSLGAAPTVCGIIIGSMAVAQVFSSVYFSAWSNRSYFRPLVFSSIMLFSGNLLYALAYDLNSLTVLLIGRILCGLGSARAVNRRYISDCVPLKTRLQASAGFVSASALGMACGPGLAGFLQTKFTIYSLTFNQSTLPGWLMSISWLLYLVWLWFSFKEPEHFAKAAASAAASESSHQESANLEEGLAQPLLIAEDRMDENSEDNDETTDSQKSHEPATSFVSAYKLLTPSVKVQLLIYFMLKYAMEILLSESSVITTYYFNWDTSAVAIFLAILGLTVLPVNALVGSYVTNWFEDRQILLASEIMVLIGIIMSFRYTPHYSIPQYVSSALITFVFAEVLEGVNLSLLSRVMSSRLSRGTYNGGLLSTEAGTLARVVADATITGAGYLGTDMLLNVTLLPPLVISIVSIVATFCTYNTLF